MVKKQEPKKRNRTDQSVDVPPLCSGLTDVSEIAVDLTEDYQVGASGDPDLVTSGIGLIQAAYAERRLEVPKYAYEVARAYTDGLPVCADAPTTQLLQSLVDGGDCLPRARRDKIYRAMTGTSAAFDQAVKAIGTAAAECGCEDGFGRNPRYALARASIGLHGAIVRVMDTPFNRYEGQNVLVWLKGLQLLLRDENVLQAMGVAACEEDTGGGGSKFSAGTQTYGLGDGLAAVDRLLRRAPRDRETELAWLSAVGSFGQAVAEVYADGEFRPVEEIAEELTPDRIYEWAVLAS
jgi:hypothetical protein